MTIAPDSSANNAAIAAMEIKEKIDRLGAG
jgi:hypothetical protein